LITIEAVVDQNEILSYCKASGHAGAGKAGADIVCAAVSVLMRTAFKTLSEKKGIVIRGDAPKPGQLWLEVDYSEEGREFLSAIGFFLLEGIRSVAEEYPDYCRLIIRNKHSSY
jgi:uncharacterized protein YsxB (DUF464 family)